MQTKQTITIIGATGKMGAASAKSLSKGNYRLLRKCMPGGGDNYRRRSLPGRTPAYHEVYLQLAARLEDII